MKLEKAEFVENDVYVSIESNRGSHCPLAIRYDGGNKGVAWPDKEAVANGQAAHAIYFNCYGHNGTKGDVAAIQILLDMF